MVTPSQAKTAGPSGRKGEAAQCRGDTLALEVDRPKVKVRRFHEAGGGEPLALEGLALRMIQLEDLDSVADVGAPEGEGVEPGADEDVLRHAPLHGQREPILGIARSRQHGRSAARLAQRSREHRLRLAGRDPHLEPVADEPLCERGSAAVSSRCA